MNCTLCNEHLIVYSWAGETTARQSRQPKKQTLSGANASVFQCKYNSYDVNNIIAILITFNSKIFTADILI